MLADGEDARTCTLRARFIVLILGPKGDVFEGRARQRHDRHVEGPLLSALGDQVDQAADHEWVGQAQADLFICWNLINRFNHWNSPFNILRYF